MALYPQLCSLNPTPIVLNKNSKFYWKLQLESLPISTLIWDIHITCTWQGMPWLELDIFLNRGALCQSTLPLFIYPTEISLSLSLWRNYLPDGSNLFTKRLKDLRFSVTWYQKVTFFIFFSNRLPKILCHDSFSRLYSIINHQNALNGASISHLYTFRLRYGTLIW